MERPEIFDETINKKTSSRNKSTIQYERGTLSQENRVYVESVANDTKYSKLPEGYDGGIIKKEFIDFEKEYPGLTFKKTDFLYDRMMNDAHNVFPRNRDLKNKVSTYFNEMIRVNLNNIYHFAPRFFTENFVQRTSVNNTAFESYQVYIYLLCFINWTDKHRNDTDVRDFDNIDKILNWISTRRDPSIEFIINGPSSNSDITNNNFRAHYKTLIDASNDMSSIIAYNQLSSTQTISSDVYALMNIIQNMPNVFFKNPDEARKYNINIDSAQDVMVTIDNDNNLIFDCSYVNLGDVTEQNKLAKFDNLESVVTNNKVQSQINTKKLAELFHNYSRIKILELIITPDAYISSLDAFNKVFVVFKGVSCSERNVYNTIPTNFLKIGGKFTKTNRGYEFKMDVDAITYKSVLADVKSFEVYLTLDPNHTNQIIPNEYALTFNKHSIYQHPITTDVVYDNKVRGQRKIVTIREQSNGNNGTVNDTSINTKRQTVDLSDLLTGQTSALSHSNNKTNQLIVNGKFSTNNDPKNRIPQHAKTNNPVIDKYLFGDDEIQQTKQSFSNLLYQMVRVSDPTKKSAVIASIDKSIEFARKVELKITDSYYIQFINRVIELLADIRTSWTYDEMYEALDLALTTKSTLTADMKSELTKIINSDSYFRINNQDDFIDIITKYPNWEELVDITKLTEYSGISSYYDTIIEVLTHDVSTTQTVRSNIVYKLKNSEVDDECFKQIQSIVWDLITNTGNVQELQNNILANEDLTTEQINSAVNVILQHNSLSYEAYEFAQSALLNQTTNDESNRLLSKIRSHKPLSTNERNAIIKAMTNYTSYSSVERNAIKSKLSAQVELSDLEKETLKIIINRSLLLEESEINALMKLMDDVVLISNHYAELSRVIDYDIDYNESYAQQMENYNKPIITEEQQTELIEQVSQYVSKSKLLTDIDDDSNTYTSGEADQILAIARSYYASLEKEKDYDPTYYVAFMKLIQSSKYYTVEDYGLYALKDNVDLVELNHFFYSVSNNINGYIKSNVDFINNYSNLLENYNVIGSSYYSYYRGIFSAMTNDNAADINQLNIVFMNFKQVYSRLFSLLEPNTIQEDNIDYTYRNVEVDTRNATVEGKYFRVDENNFVYFDGVDTPDPDYLIYTEQENDLTLINLYTKYNEIINPVIKGTFIYSESLGTIQNLSYPLFDYTGYQNIIRFDNNYNTNKGNTQTTTHDANHLISTSADNNDMFYTYSSKSYGLVFVNLLDSISCNLASINSITNSYRWNQLEQTIRNEVLISFDDMYYDATAKTFTAACKLNRYDYIIQTNPSEVSEYVWSKSDCEISAELTFVKIDDVDEELIKNDPDNGPNQDTFISMYYVFGTINTVNISNNSGEGNTDAWNNIQKDELICFITRLAKPNIEPSTLLPEITVNNVNQRTTGWVVYNVLIEPSLYGEVDDLVIKDTLNNQTIISKYFNVSFNNSLGFESLDDILTNPDISSPYTNLENDIYAIQSEEQRDTYIYNVNYVYNRANTTFSIITNIEKEGTDTQYREYVSIHLSKKFIYRWSVNHLTETITTEQEIINVKLFSKQTLDQLRDSSTENPAVGYFDFYHFGIEEKYGDTNNENCNNYKAYAISGIDVKKAYWNKSAFINSLMLCPVSSMTEDSIDPEYTTLEQTVEYNGKTDKVIIYNYDNGFRRFENKVKINPDGITQYDENDNEINGVILNIFVNRNQKITCFAEYQEVLADNYQVKTYYITNNDNKYYFQLTLTANEDNITNLSLSGIDGLINNTILETITNEQNTENLWIQLGTVNNTVSSGQPVYIYYKDMGFEIIINYESQFSEFPTNKQITINNISISYIKYSTIHFVVDRTLTTNKVSYAPIETVRYSNIPADYCDESDILFGILGEVDTVFKLCPVFKYYEKCIVSPRYVDENGDYILLATKYNQNIMAKPVYLRSQYNLNNPSNNTLRDSPDIVYKIGDKLDPNKKHLLESVNKSMIMLGSVESDGTIAEIAIKANQIHAIPTASKMLLSIEFS